MAGKPKKTTKRPPKYQVDEDLYFGHEEKIKKKKKLISEILFKKLNIKAKTPNQKALQKSIRENSLTIVKGRPGTGKTFLALAEALDLLLDEKTPYVELYIFKSAKTLEEEDIGYMPGDEKDKLKLPLLSYMMNLTHLLDESQIEYLIDGKIIQMLPLGYIRGSSIRNAVVLLDEAQNVTLKNARTAMTRMADTSKLIIMGDENQLDIKQNKISSLRILAENFNEVHSDIGVVELGIEDIQRSELIKFIENKFDDILENIENGRERKPKQLNS